MNNKDDQAPDQVQTDEQIYCPIRENCSKACMFYDCETDQQPACIIARIRVIDSKIDEVIARLSYIQSEVENLQD